MKDIEKRCLARRDWHGEWNYALTAHPAGPEPEPPPPAHPSRLASRDTLNHPALTGAGPAAVTALAAALANRFDARLEHDLRVRRGPRRIAPGGGSPRRLDTTDYLLAALIRRHLRVPSHVTAALLGIHEGTVRHAIALVTTVLEGAGTPLPPPACPPLPHRLRTLDDLREHAARHGIAIDAPPQPTPLHKPH